MTTRVLNFRIVFLTLLTIFVIGCTGDATMIYSDMKDVLRIGHGEGVDFLSQEILDGRIEITQEMIWDREEFPIHIRLSGVSDFEGVTYYLSGSVSQYVLCLLETRENISTKWILDKIRPDLIQELSDNEIGEESCGVCCGIYPGLTREVEDTLRMYWIGRLNL